MKQNALECHNDSETWPYEVWYYTEKQKNRKVRYFHSIEEIKKWCRTHKTARIEAASWQVFAVRDGMP